MTHPLCCPAFSILGDIAKPFILLPFPLKCGLVEESCIYWKALYWAKLWNLSVHTIMRHTSLALVKVFVHSLFHSLHASCCPQQIESDSIICMIQTDFLLHYSHHRSYTARKCWRSRLRDIASSDSAWDKGQSWFNTTLKRFWKFSTR